MFLLQNTDKHVKQQINQVNFLSILQYVYMQKCFAHQCYIDTICILCYKRKIRTFAANAQLLNCLTALSYGSIVGQIHCIYIHCVMMQTEAFHVVRILWTLKIESTMFLQEDCSVQSVSIVCILSLQSNLLTDSAQAD